MKLQKNNLQKALARVSGVIKQNALNPITTSVKFQLYDGKIIITGTDTETEIKALLEIESFSEQNFSVAIPYKIFSDIVKSASGEFITLNFDDSLTKLVVKTETGGKYSIPLDNADLFPNATKIDTQYSFSVSAEVLYSALNQVAFGMSKNTFSNLKMCGVSFLINDAKVELCGTDGQVMSIDEFYIDTIFDSKKQFIVYRDAVYALLTNLKGKESLVEVTFDSNSAKFKCEDFSVQTLLVNGEFPPYNDVTPKTYSNKTSLNKQEFLDAVKRVAIAGDAFSCVKVSFGEKIVISVNNEFKEISAEETLLHYPENEFKVDLLFNSSYLIQVLSNLDADTVIEIELEDSKKMVLFHSKNENVSNAKIYCIPYLI